MYFANCISTKLLVIGGSILKQACFEKLDLWSIKCQLIHNHREPIIWKRHQDDGIKSDTIGFRLQIYTIMNWTLKQTVHYHQNFKYQKLVSTIIYMVWHFSKMTTSNVAVDHEFSIHSLFYGWNFYIYYEVFLCYMWMKMIHKIVQYLFKLEIFHISLEQRITSTSPQVNTCWPV